MNKIKERMKSIQRLGVLVLGIALLLGVSQASTLKRMLSGGAGEESSKLTAQVSPAATTINNAGLNTNLTGDTAQTGEVSSGAPNIVDLVGESELIIRGMVTGLTDGFENGVPYTQVTVQVNEALRGQVGGEYTFRQFGLIQPRKLENGKTYLGTTPEGWSKYKEGEDVVLFLYKQASVTGLRTTVGLGQGKVVFQSGNATSQLGNEGLFENVDVDAKLLNDKDKRLLATKKGAVNADGFMSFVRRAVKNKWVEGGKMRHVKK